MSKTKWYTRRHCERSVAIFLALALALSLGIVALPMAGTVEANSPEIHVPTDYPTIQAAIDAATDDDTVLVAQGTYFENIDFKGKTITLKSASGPSVTTIDGGNSGTVVTFNSTEGPNSVIEGFTITSGNATNTVAFGVAAGGILCDGASPTIINNDITGNSARNSQVDGGGAGGGIACDNGASPTITNNTISDNSAINEFPQKGYWPWQHCTTASGGIHVDRWSCPTITGNTIVDNYGYNWENKGHSAGGIGVVHWSEATIVGNTITRNRADEDASGGGLVVTWGATATIDRNFITDNEATNNRTHYSAAGGGLFADKGGKALITNNLFLRNSAIDTRGGHAGGAIMQKWELNALPVINNTIVDNYATATGRAAGGICHDDWTSTSLLTITNNIIWNNLVGDQVVDLSLDAYPGWGTVTYNDISEALFPDNNISADPCFVDVNDFHLLSDSPCIDKGTNDGAPPLDLEGRIRPWDGDANGTDVTDMGCYEFGAPLPTVPMASFVIDHAKIDFKKKPDDVTVTLDVSFSGNLTEACQDTKLDFGCALASDMAYYDACASWPTYPDPLMENEFNNHGTYTLYSTADDYSDSQQITLEAHIGDCFEIDAYLHAHSTADKYYCGDVSVTVNGTIEMTVSASGAAIEPIFGDYEPGIDDLTFFYSYVGDPYSSDWWDETGDMSKPGASVLMDSNVGDCSTSDDWSKPFDNSDQFSMEVYATATPPSQYVDAAARIRVRYKIVRPDDKVHVRGTLELDLVNGDGVDISEPVTVTVGPLSETITMVEKGKKGEKWEYKRPKGGTGDIKHMTINWKNGKFDIRMDKAELTGMSNPVTISVQIGDDFGEETIPMREKKHHWDYKAPRH